MKTLPLFVLLPVLTQCTAFDPMAYNGYGTPSPPYAGIWASQPPPHLSGPSSTEPSQVDSGPRQRSRRPPYPMDGSLTESSTGNRTWRDRSTGEITGSEWTSPAGNTTYRNSSGSITGSSSESPAGTRTYRDDNGSITGTSSTSQGSSGDNNTTFRRNGVIVGSKYVSPAGNITWRDGSGSIIDGPSGMKE